MKRVLILGAPIFQIPVVKKAKEMGLYVGIVDIDTEAPALSYADEQYNCSLKDMEKVLEVATRFGPDGVIIGACDTSVIAGAYVSKVLNLPGHSMETAINSTNKLKMLEVFKKKNIPHPMFQVVSKDEIDSFEMTLPYPVISKPTDSAGGRGVSIIHNSRELKNAVGFSSRAGISGDVLIEEYMRGPEVSVEVLIVDNEPFILQVTDKITSGEPFFYEVGHSQPSSLPPDVLEIVKEVASNAVLAIGLNNTPAHVEIIITENGPMMVELGARLGGDCITSYLIDTSVSGINMIEATIKLALGESPIVCNYYNSGVAVGIRFIPAKAGILKDIHGMDEAYKCDNIVSIEIVGEIGKRYEDAMDDSARFGYVICTGNTTEEALCNTQEVIDKIHFEME